MGALEELYSDANQAPRPLWQLRSWEAGEEQLGARELAIRTKVQELADRNNEIGGAISDIWEVAGVIAQDSIGTYPTAEVQLPADPATGTRFSARLGRSPSGSAWIKYFEYGFDGNRVESCREVSRSERHHTSVFDADDTTALRLELQYGTFTWVNDNVDYDNSRVEILEDAEGMVSAWEGITTMLSQAIRDHELNPEFAAAMAEKDAAARERAENNERIAAFLTGRRSVAD